MSNFGNALKDLGGKIVIAMIPTLVNQAGQAIREHLKWRKNKYCDHGKYKGKKCEFCHPDTAEKTLGGYTIEDLEAHIEKRKTKNPDEI